jgi:hypothetical protein
MFPSLSLLLVSLARRCSSLCESNSISGHFEHRTVITTGNCVVFVDCVFDSVTTSEHGGAINVENAGHEIAITDSLSYLCTARSGNYDIAGGAFWLVGDPVLIGRCCASTCVTTHGQAFFFDEHCVCPGVSLWKAKGVISGKWVSAL